ncbi:hypothetical protein [Polyangium fumosum]|uniref:Uncharacterized protein n=1 Tax=Polyangium fumosum TaxID=889272 RepID=A0A4U1IW20_9BACT|nr:hypothetical protein [Polyangium fumosum]TKC98731.1 hypothetical protein E8A74_40215 [Polyangium fumosum]
MPVPEWVKTHVQAKEWQGERLAIEGLSRAAEELEGQLPRMERLDLMRWLWNENEVAVDIDPALLFLVLARDLRDLGIGGDLEIGGL